jgi:phosphopantetheine--protein transferase-like protein
MMQEKIKEILSVFLKIPEEQINGATVIDRSAVNSSILLHRMYAKLAAEGVVVQDYQQLRTFGELLKRLGGDTDNAAILPPASAANQVNEQGIEKDNTGIGIDIEMVSAMPVTGDFREDAFYTMNFSVTEIAYCILQPNPYASFAGLFAAKEAIVKADNTYKKTAFKHIPVQHLSNGKPFHAGFTISVSHTDEMAVAVAVPIRHIVHVGNETVTSAPAKAVSNTSPAIWLLVLTSLLLSVIALFLIAGKK